MIKDIHSTTRRQRRRRMILPIVTGISLTGLLLGSFWLGFEQQYKGKIYPNVTIAGTDFGGKLPADVQAYWEKQNIPFEDAVFEFRFEGNVATVSGAALNLGYDATLSATQALSV